MNWITENRRNMPLVVLLSVAALILAAGGDAWRTALRYDRTLMASEWWRWIGAHLVHASWSHTLLNLAGLWVVWLLFKGRLRGWPGLVIALLSLLVMDAGFWFRDTQLGWYVGMSGLLHGLYVAGAWDEFWRGIRGGGVLLTVGAAKLAYEQFFGALPLSESSSGSPVWVNSHLYGAVGGFLAATLLNLRTRFSPAAIYKRRGNGES